MAIYNTFTCIVSVYIIKIPIAAHRNTQRYRQIDRINRKGHRNEVNESMDSYQ